MRDIAHFGVGVAIASCVPGAVEMGAAGNPLPFVLGGVCGLLPDTLDARFSRLLCRHHLRIRPDPLRPDATPLAAALAQAVERAAAGRRPLCVQFDAARLGADAWQSYEVEFDPPGRRVLARFGDVVGADGGVVRPSAGRKAAVAPLPCGLKLEGTACLRVGAFDGAELTLAPLADGRVAVCPAPWQRRWSHSFTLALAAGLLAGALAGWRMGAIAAAAWAAHGLLDQFGRRGAALLYPFRRERGEGLRVARSASATQNLSVVWAAGAVLFWNLHAASQAPIAGMNPLRYGVMAIALPLGLLALGGRLLRRPAQAD